MTNDEMHMSCVFIASTSYTYEVHTATTTTTSTNTVPSVPTSWLTE